MCSDTGAFNNYKIEEKRILLTLLSTPSRGPRPPPVAPCPAEPQVQRPSTSVSFDALICSLSAHQSRGWPAVRHTPARPWMSLGCYSRRVLDGTLIWPAGGGGFGAAFFRAAARGRFRERIRRRWLWERW